MSRQKINFDSFDVRFDIKAFCKIKKYCEVASGNEWLCFLLKDEKKTKGNEIFVNDLYFPPQIVSGGNCTLLAEEFAIEIEKMIKTEDGRTKLTKFCGWMHSHNTMGTFFSSTDDEANKRMRQYMPTTKIFVSLVTNNKLDFSGLAMVKMKSTDQTVKDISVSVSFDDGDSMLKSCMTDWSRQVKVDALPAKYHTPTTDIVRIPSKHRCLTVKLVDRITLEVDKVIYARNLEWTINSFLAKRNLRSRQRKAVNYLFRALFLSRITTEEAMENFAVDYKKKKSMIETKVEETTEQNLNKSMDMGLWYHRDEFEYGWKKENIEKERNWYDY